MASVLERRVAGFRRFNRFFTKRIGVLTDNFLRSGFTLAESRVLWELAQRESTSPGDLAAALEMDPGYLSRLVQRLEKQGHVSREVATADKRRALLALTDTGRAAFAPLNERQHDDIVTLLEPLPAERQETIVRAMAEIEGILGSGTARGEIKLRDPAAGDLGWVVERHGAIYGAEYGFNVHMEGDVAAIVSAFVADFRPGSDRCWIAERDGVRCGCVFVVHDDDTTARIRLLLLEPFARGSGLGRRLVRECIGFARAAGYTRLVLWTHTVLTAARAIYASEGFVLTATESNARWGPPITSETWKLTL